MKRFAFATLALLFAVSWQVPTGNAQDTDAAAKTKPEPAPIRVVFLAGRPSHGYGAHEHYAGCKVLAERLSQAMPNVETAVFKYEWPDDPTVFDDCNAIVMYCDGGPRHPVNEHLDQVDELAKRGVGIVCLHYGVEVPKGKSGDRFLDWIGGYFEENWSVNPHWTASFETLPDHPVSRGVKPFHIHDEWYFHMRFREGMDGVTPILTAQAPDDTMVRPDGTHSGNPHVRKAVAEKIPQHVAWAFERPGGGRGFGFTGGHDHWNWGNENFRKIVLNAIVWTAGGDVPENGVADKQAVTTEEALEELKQNQDFPAPDKYDWDRAKERISSAPPDSNK